MSTNNSNKKLTFNTGINTTKSDKVPGRTKSDIDVKKSNTRVNKAKSTTSINQARSNSKSREGNLGVKQKTSISALDTTKKKSETDLPSTAVKLGKELELNEEWSNFMTRVGHVTSLVKDMACGDKAKADAAQKIADNYLEGKVIVDENVEMKIKDNRTVINQKAFKSIEMKDAGEVDKEIWMAEMTKDADRRAHDRKIRKEKADTLNTQAIKAFRREEYEKALSCYNRAIEQIRDNAMLYCDRALTNIKLKHYEKVLGDCDLALRLNENSYKARLYNAKAYKELDEKDKFEECKKELQEKFPQHEDLTTSFLEKKDQEYEYDKVPESDEDNILF